MECRSCGWNNIFSCWGDIEEVFSKDRKSFGWEKHGIQIDYFSSIIQSGCWKVDWILPSPKSCVMKSCMIFPPKICTFRLQKAWRVSNRTCVFSWHLFFKGGFNELIPPWWRWLRYASTFTCKLVCVEGIGIHDALSPRSCIRLRRSPSMVRFFNPSEPLLIFSSGCVFSLKIKQDSDKDDVLPQ